jgi:hypothetical protein
MTAPSRESAVTTPAGSRTTLALATAAAFGAGFLAYYAIDRITFLTGHTIRDIRHAGRAAA